MIAGLYDLDVSMRMDIARIIKNGFRQHGFTTVPNDRKKFYTGYEESNLHSNVVDYLASKDISIDCGAEDAYVLYDEVMR